MIGTTYNGHEITFSEGDEVWECRELGLSAPKLSTLKAKLDEIERAARRVDAVPVYFLGDGYGIQRLTPAVVTLLDENHEKSLVPKVFIILNEGRQARRMKVPIDRVAPRTPEAKAAFEAYTAADQAAHKARSEAERASKAIPRIAVADLKPVAQPPAEAAE